MVLRGMLIASTRLLALRRSIGVVHSEDQGGRGRGLAGKAVVHHGARKPIAVLAVHRGRQPGARRGPRAVGRRLPGTPLHPEWDQGGMAAMLGVMRGRLA